MGSSRYDDHIYKSRIDKAAADGADIFKHDAAVRSGKASTEVHPLLDPKKKNGSGKIVRESFDSDKAPNSRAVGVIFDETGSMTTVPRLFVLKLQKLMAALVKKGFIPDPHVLFGAVGDAYSDRVPLQIGQFEGGNEMDETLSNIFLEGNGGAQDTESYDLAMYFMARHTDMDCYKKRGQKGYLFLLGDERVYPVVKKSQVKEFIGDELEADIPVTDILKELQQKFNVFWVMPGGTQHWEDETVIEPMRKLFGQNFILLANPEDVVELIVSTIGVTEGYDLHDVGAALRDVGSDAEAVKRAGAALVPYASSGLAKTAVASGALVEAGTDDVARL